MSRSVQCIPSDDADFRDAATATLNGIDAHVKPDEIGSVMTGLLRVAYPGVHVHRQHELARIADDDLWYVYRDRKPIKEFKSAAPDTD